MDHFENEIAFITGGASGAGFGQAQVFGRAGCRIVIADIRPQPVEEALAQLRADGITAHGIVLAARARGLHTCAEASIASYPDIVRRELGISRDWTIMCGMAMGYADPDAVVNTFQPPRIAMDEYATFYD